jgi:hypothetical protein
MLRTSTPNILGRTILCPLVLPFTDERYRRSYVAVFSFGLVGQKTALIIAKYFLIFRLSPNSKRETTNSYSSPTKAGFSLP